MREQTRAKLDAVEGFRAKGMSLAQACKKARVSSATYYANGEKKAIVNNTISRDVAILETDIELLTRIFDSNLAVQDKLVLTRKFF